MTSKNNSPQWQKVEQLVALIEQAIDSSSSTVHWNETILDADSGEPRQVDIVIKNRLGTAEVFVAIECRNRIRPAGSQWIEELIGKQKSIGAAKMIAVSTSGFTKPAIAKANALGIDTRNLDTVSVNDIRQWSNFVEFIFQNTNFNVSSVKLFVEEYSENDSLNDLLPAADFKSFSADVLHHELARASNTNIPVVIDSMVKNLLNNSALPLKPEPSNGESESLKLLLRPSETDGDWIIETTCGPKKLISVGLEVTFTYEVHRKTKDDIVATKYQNEGEDIAHHITISCDTSLGQHGLTSVLMPDGTQKLFLQVDKNSDSSDTTGAV